MRKLAVSESCFPTFICIRHEGVNLRGRNDTASRVLQKFFKPELHLKSICAASVYIMKDFCQTSALKLFDKIT